MKPFAFFTLILLTVVALVAIAQIPLVQAVVTASGYPAAEVWAGIGAILLVFYTLLAVFTLRF